jgi:hypothetical protein
VGRILCGLLEDEYRVRFRLLMKTSLLTNRTAQWIKRGQEPVRGPQLSVDPKIRK